MKREQPRDSLGEELSQQREWPCKGPGVGLHLVFPGAARRAGKPERKERGAGTRGNQSSEEGLNG